VFLQVSGKLHVRSVKQSTIRDPPSKVNQSGKGATENKELDQEPLHNRRARLWSKLKQVYQAVPCPALQPSEGRSLRLTTLHGNFNGMKAQTQTVSKGQADAIKM